MRILEVNTEKGWRGGEKQTLLTAIGLADLGEDVTLLCGAGSALHQRAAAHKIKTTAVSNSLELLAFLASGAREFDCIHVHTARDQTFAVISKWIHQRPIVYSRRVEFVPTGRLTRLKYRFTDRVTVISERVKQVVDEFTGQDAPNIPDAVQIKSLSKERALQFLNEKSIQFPFLLGTMAALTPEKDPFTLLEAIRQLTEKRNDFVLLHFGDGPLYSPLKQKIEELNLGNQYRLLGFTENPEDFFSVLSVYVMSSAQEGLGSTVLEAMLYGVPVVTTDAGGLRETAGKFGWISPVGDPAALAANLDRVLTSRETPEILKQTEQARSWAMEKFSLEAVSRDYQAVFRSL